MCGRYTLVGGETQPEGLRLLQQMEKKPESIALKGKDIFPSEQAPVYAVQQGKVKLQSMRWGLPNPYRNGLIINARAETASQKSCFRPVCTVCGVWCPAPGFMSGISKKTGTGFHWGTAGFSIWRASTPTGTTGPGLSS